MQDVQMIDFELGAGGSISHEVPEHLDNCLVYVYRGAGTVGGEKTAMHNAVRFDASNSQARRLDLASGKKCTALYYRYIIPYIHYMFF